MTRGSPEVSRTRYALAMSVSLVAIGTAAIWARAAGETTALLLVFGRGLISGLVTLPWFLSRRLPWRQVRAAMLAGAFLALHFWLWFASLKLTSVAASTTLVCTTALWLGLIDIAQGRRVPATLWGAIVLGIAGTALIGLGDVQEGNGLTGALLALGGAWAAAAYMLANRHGRGDAPLLAFVTITNLTSAALTLPILAVLGALDRLVVAPEAWWCIVGLAVIPQLIGHNLLVWGLRHRGPTVVSLVWLGEPVIAALLACAIWREIPGVLTLAGAALVLPALGYAMRAEEDRAGDAG